MTTAPLKCTCPTVHFSPLLLLPIIRHPDCPIHGTTEVERHCTEKLFDSRQIRVGDVEYETERRRWGRPY